MWHDSFIRDSTHSYVTRSYVAWLVHVRHDSFIPDTTDASGSSDPSSTMWHDSFIQDRTHSYVKRSYVTWLIYMRHDSWNVIWLTRVKAATQVVWCDMTYPYRTWPVHTWNGPLKWDVTHTSGSSNTSCVMWQTRLTEVAALTRAARCSSRFNTGRQ